MSVWHRTFTESPAGNQWTAPENEEVWTKIFDSHGARNEAKLTRKGNLWFTEPEGGMYVYYTPTHWHR